MCGRYRRTTSEEELARRYHIPIPPQRDLPISWNIAPTQDVLAIRLHPETKQRTLDPLRWGLIPNWGRKIQRRTPVLLFVRGIGLECFASRIWERPRRDDPTIPFKDRTNASDAGSTPNAIR